MRKLIKIAIVCWVLVAVILVGQYLLAHQQKSFSSPESNQAPHLHYSAFSQAEFFDKAFSLAPQLPSGFSAKAIKGILFNHHLLAPHFIAQTFLAVESEKPLTVILISPNHFRVGNGQIITSEFAWQTPYGVLDPDLALILKLKQSGEATVDEKPFENEHGIYNIVSFIKRALPNARVVPIIIKDSLSPQKADQFAASLIKSLPKDYLIAGSFDFSHYKTLDVANKNDEKSLVIVSKLDYTDTGDLDIDSRPGLRLFLEVLKVGKAENFTLLQHSNSAVVSGNLAATSTTSYITGYFTSN